VQQLSIPLLNSEKLKNDYNEGKLIFPDNSVQKDNKYFLAAAKSVAGMYTNNMLTIGLGGNGNDNLTGFKIGGLNSSIRVLRDYANARQSVTHLADELDPCDPNTGLRLWGVSWTPRDFYTKFRNIAKAKTLQYGFKPAIVCNDELGIGEKDELIAKEKLKINPRAKQIAQIIGADEESEFETNQDVEDYAALGGFQTDIEIAVHDGIQECLLNSGFDTIESMLTDDLIDVGYCMITCEADVYTRKPVIKYADIATSFFMPSIYYDHRDTTLAGKFEQMSIPELRVYLNREHDEETTEEIIAKCCYNYQNWNGSNHIASNLTGLFNNSAERRAYSRYNNTLPYNHFSIAVMTAWFVASDVETFVSGTHHKYGNAIYDKVNNDAKLKKVDEERGKKIDKKTLQNCYRVRWIVGTDYVFDCGLDHAIVREGATGAKRALTPCVIYGSPSPSMTQRAIDSIDDAQRAVFKMRHTFKNMPPLPLMSVDLSALLDSVEMAGERITYKDLLEKGKRTGIFAYMSKNEFNETGASNKKPITFETQNFISEILNLNNLKLQAIDEIRQILGINDVSDGSNTSPELLVGVVQGANMATNNALFDIINARRTVRLGIYNIVGKKFLSAVAAGEISGRYFTNNRVRQYRLTPELADRDFSFFITTLPTEERKQALYQELAKLSQLGQISSGDYLTTINMIADDDIRKAEYYLTKSSKKANELAHKQSVQVQQAQGQANADAAVQTEQAKAQTLQMQNAMNMELEKLKQQGAIEQIKEKTKGEKEVEQMRIDAQHLGIGLTAAVAPQQSQTN